MLRSVRLLSRLLLACLVAVQGGCGAGLITGLSSGKGGGTSARPPELSITPALPLVPVANTTRTVVVANVVIPSSARLRVELIAAGVTVAQRNPTVSGQGGSTSITFTLDTADIANAVADRTAADVPGKMRVLVDDIELVPEFPVTLYRQIAASLEVSGVVDAQFLSPLGQRVTLRLRGLRHNDPSNLQMLVSTRDPAQVVPPGSTPTRIQRVCSTLQIDSVEKSGDVLVSAVVPGNPFPDRIGLFVRDNVSGESTVADNVYYRPEVALALPSQGSTTGGNLVTLIGTALVPYDFTGAGAAPLSFDSVSFSFHKGGRVKDLPRDDFRSADSGLDRLVLAMPASPDGRPGQVDIVLRVDLEGATAEVTVGGLFLYANADPFFGPRGAVLQELPVAVVPIGLDDAPITGGAPDVAVLTEEGGVGFLELLLAQQNGMFQRFGARRQIGNHEVPAERNPRGLCTGDFNGDGIPDLFIANEGAATAVHHVVLGRAKPAPPLDDQVFHVSADPGTSICRTADFDGNGLTDVLLVPGPAAPANLQPQLLLAATPGSLGQPVFADPVHVPVRADMHYEAVEIADLDGDGHLDIAVVSGTELKLSVAWGRGDGTFDPVATQLDFVVQGYTPDPGSPAVGLHACRNGPLQTLGLVLAGLPLPQQIGLTPPLVATLHQVAARVYAEPQQSDVYSFPSDPLGYSLAADLDNANTIELAVAARGIPTVASLALLRFDGSKFGLIEGSVEIGAELLRNIQAMHFGRAFPATSSAPESNAIFVVHESVVDNQIERRLSTRLLFRVPPADGLILLPPDAGASVNVDVEGIVGGNFRPTSVANAGTVRDLAIGRTGGIDLIENDGFGGQPLPAGTLLHNGLLPPTMTLIPGATGQPDSIAFLDSQSRVGVWRPDQAVPAPDEFQSVTSLSQAIQAGLPSASLDATSQLRLADVDGDGVPDLVALLRFGPAWSGAADAGLVLLRGRPNPQPGEFPFYQPATATSVHGNATSFALGDFSAAGAGLPKHLELALAVPVGSTAGAIDGDHVRFYRYVAGSTPEMDHFEASAVAGGPQVLLAGRGPTRVVAGDFDRDGRVDLLVAAGGDSTLRLFRNIAAVTGNQGEVAVGAFVESLSSPLQLPSGTPRDLRLGDVNGDGSTDVIAVVETTATGVRSTSVSFYLSTAPGVFGERNDVSPYRLGDRDATLALDLGDWNRDGVLDLFLGWNTHGGPPGPTDRNVRVLFGGSR